MNNREREGETKQKQERKGRTRWHLFLVTSFPLLDVYLQSNIAHALSYAHCHMLKFMPMPQSTHKQEKDTKQMYRKACAFMYFRLRMPQNITTPPAMLTFTIFPQICTDTRVCIYIFLILCKYYSDASTQGRICKHTVLHIDLFYLFHKVYIFQDRPADA